MNSNGKGRCTGIGKERPRLIHLPLSATDKANTLAQQLSHYVASIVIDGFGMLVGVAEDRLNMFGSGKDAGSESFQ